MSLAAAYSADQEMPSHLRELLSKTQPYYGTSMPHAGDISPLDAHAFMGEHPSLLIDVRTMPEWQFVGTPDLQDTQAKLLTISWKIYPGFTPNPQFVDSVAAAAEGDKDLPLFFICRSGGRSLDAAAAMTMFGYRYCFNIIGGFEGEPDGLSQRGKQSGWKASNLAWKQG